MIRNRHARLGILIAVLAVVLSIIPAWGAGATAPSAVGWTDQFGTGGGDNMVLGVAASGSVYVVGVTGAFPGEGPYDGFVRTYDSAGSVVWTDQFGTGAYDSVSGVGIDGSGNVYIAGNTNGVFAGETSNGDWDGFVRKYLGSVERFAGQSRYATAAEISADRWPSGASRVYVAFGRGFADALAGGVAAGVSGSPVLLVNSDSIPAETAAELTRLAPDEIVILGGRSAVSSGVESVLGSYASSVRRLWGPDRFATAAAVAVDAFPGGAGTVLVTDGNSFPDALAGVPAGAQLRAPLLLTRSGLLPQATADAIVALGTSRVVILGGTGAVSADVEAALGALSGVNIGGTLVWVVEVWDGCGDLPSRVAGWGRCGVCGVRVGLSGSVDRWVGGVHG